MRSQRRRVRLGPPQRSAVSLVDEDRLDEHRQILVSRRIPVRLTDDVRHRSGDAADEKCRHVRLLPNGEIASQNDGDLGVELHRCDGSDRGDPGLSRAKVRTLYLLRHAKSSWADPMLPDRERPLAPRGRRDAERIANHLLRLESSRSSSCAPRPREHARRSSCCNLRSARRPSCSRRSCTPHPGTSCSRASCSSPTRSCPCLIGHNPGLHQLALVLVSAGEELGRLEAKFPTGALATLALAKSWSRLVPGDAMLAAYVVPRQLR